MNTTPSPMVLLVTGGTGFVMCNAVKQALESDPDASAVLLDLAPVEGIVADFLAPVRERVTDIQGDIRDRSLLEDIAGRWPITHVLHAATVTHFPAWERDRPSVFIDINVMGTVAVLEWARRLDGLRQFINVSSGGVYGEPTADSPAGPQPETGPFNPPELYAISKLASEQIVRRYGELFDMTARSVRLSGVFGPMERPTPGRVAMSMPYHAMRSVIERRPFRLTAGTLQAGGDLLSASDIGAALHSILHSDNPRHGVYNIAFGAFVTIPEFLDACQAAMPGFHFETVAAPAAADVALDPDHRRARWNAYAIDRITSEFGWLPRPLDRQLRDYHDWVMDDPDRRCPPIGDPGSSPD